jgi:hypothetical protein
MEKIIVSYYKLKEPKVFNNKNSINGGTLLIKSSVVSHDKTLYNTVEDNQQIHWFYALDSEVEFLEEKEEMWSIQDLEARRKMMDDWL